MSYVKVNKSGKGGPACSWAFDVESGCSNSCQGCYGSYTSRRGPDKYKNNIIKKEYNDVEFLRSIKGARKKGMGILRSGKHSDPYSTISSGETIRAIEAATSAGIRNVTISKSVSRSSSIVDLYKDNGNVLHISLGMLCGIRNEDRLSMFSWYRSQGANVKLRIVEDITSPMFDRYRGLNNNDVILTPMRFKSKHDAAIYNVNLDNYEYVKGYYRPKFMHSSWIGYQNICGEVSGRTFCCNCLVCEDTNV